MTIQFPEAAYKLEKNLIQLVLDHCFFGRLTMQLSPIEDVTCRSMWTDGKHLGYSPPFVMACTDSEVQYVLAHEGLHPAFLHTIRRGNRQPGLWNMATDYQINYILDTAKVGTPPADRLRSKELDDLGAERCYAILYKAQQEQLAQIDYSGQGTGEGQGTAEGEDPDSSNNQSQDDDEGGEDDQDESEDGEFDEDALEGGGSYGPDGDGDDDMDDEDGEGPGGYDVGSTAEKIMDTLPDLTNLDEDPGACGEVRDAQDPNTQQGLTKEQKEQLERDYKVILAQALQQAKARGDLPAGLERLVGDLIDPELAWEDAVALWLTEKLSNEDYTWSPPNRRYVWQNVCLPALHSEGGQHLVMGVDTSGSIDEQKLKIFCSNVSATLQHFNVILHVVYCDSMIQGVEEFTQQDHPFVLHPKGGGGTDFGPVFEWVEQQEWRPVGLVYFTDLWGRHWQKVPDYPVLWVAQEDNHSVLDSYPIRFGEVIWFQDK